MIINDIVCDRCDNRKKLEEGSIPNGWHKIFFEWEVCHPCFLQLKKLVGEEIKLNIDKK